MLRSMTDTIKENLRKASSDAYKALKANRVEDYRWNRTLQKRLQFILNSMNKER